jgi:hypothetical protein
MIKREFFVVIVDNSTRAVKSIEARCDSVDNANMFIEENAYLMKETTNQNCSFKINEVVVIEG